MTLKDRKRCICCRNLLLNRTINGESKHNGHRQRQNNASYLCTDHQACPAPIVESIAQKRGSFTAGLADHLSSRFYTAFRPQVFPTLIARKRVGAPRPACSHTQLKVRLSVLKPPNVSNQRTAFQINYTSSW